jgi:hypothetical protein
MTTLEKVFFCNLYYFLEAEAISSSVERELKIERELEKTIEERLQYWLRNRKIGPPLNDTAPW